MEYQLIARHTHQNPKYGYLMVGDLVKTESAQEAASLLDLRGGNNYGAKGFGRIAAGQGFPYFSAVNFTLAQLKAELDGGAQAKAEAEAKLKAEAEAKAKAEAEAQAKAEAEAKAKAEADAQAKADETKETKKK